jgi:hypothetical protein
MKSSHLKVGDRVQDRETGLRGEVVYCYRDPMLDGLVAVQWEDTEAPICCHVDDVRRVS